MSAWSNFYVMIGSSSAALTGLMFVVIGLVMNTQRRSGAGISVFSTPTVVHLAAALFISAVALAPWTSLVTPLAIAAVTGVAGAAYMLVLMYRTRTFEDYRADLEDWAWYNVLPFAAYAALFAGAVMGIAHGDAGAFVVAGASLMLVFVGIRNAWDIVTFIVVGRGD
jgi:hypothetical protein